MKPLDILFPESCVGCGDIIEGGALCPQCFGTLSRFEKRSKSDAGVYFLYDYAGRLLTKIVMEMKKSKSKSLISFASMGLSSYISDILGEGASVTLTYVPRKLTNRLVFGTDQSHCIAKRCAALLGAEYRSLFRRSPFSLEQKKLNASDRAENIKEKLSVKAGVILPERVAVIDDVTTTGSTLCAARDALINAGMPEDRIYLFAFAARDFGKTDIEIKNRDNFFCERKV